MTTKQEETPFDHDPRLLEDLDLVERTPHAMRGEKWLAATKRLDDAGVTYTPGARYNAPKPAPVAEEPAYMMFARANVRDGMNSTPGVVAELLKRIDRLEGK